MLHGIVLTSASSVADIYYVLEKGGYNAVKVITEWGIANRRWTQDLRAQVARSTKHLVVRTVEGDALQGHPFPHAKEVLDEIRYWIAVTPPDCQLYIQPGNEPGTPEVAGYAWQLSNTILQIKNQYPKVKIISPALAHTEVIGWSGNRQWQSALENLCDYIGVHQYAYHSLVLDDTTQRSRLERFVSRKKPWAITEMGINNPDLARQVKIGRYKNYVKGLNPNRYAMAFDYHLCTHPIDKDQADYSLRPEHYG